MQWKQANLHVGDKIEIMATEIEVVSSVVERGDIDRQHMLAAYQNLKEFLIKEGRLK
ncbi:hypothetical protein GCM10017764_20400 [Sphingobacterium griseoflavum]|uniref:Uncharacterized protein n=1 Tax=Sphingobacterium griseoflavum TaxID=1474952 RepID=A0ABQ3HXX8_9SPHI|nr:hypothetical protein GCM10017764_20400 [Sphingobacterium griseoflavum]